MNPVTVNAEMRAKLQGLEEPIDFCDEQGQLLGRFLPYPEGVKPADLEPEISAAEMRRRAENFQGRPLSELIAQWERRK